MSTTPRYFDFKVTATSVVNGAKTKINLQM